MPIGLLEAVGIGYWAVTAGVAVGRGRRRSARDRSICRRTRLKSRAARKASAKRAIGNKCFSLGAVGE